MLCAVIQNNIVTEVSDLTDEAMAAIFCQQIIDVSNYSPTPSVGWVFNGSSIVPPVGVNAHIPMIITKLAFRNRCTFAELCALQAAAATSIPLQVLKDNLSVATYIDLERPDTIQAIGLIASMGIITPARANTILTAIPTATEIYKG